MPDLPYFFFLKAHGFDGHTLPGIFLFDLPVGFLVLWLFFRYMKRPSLIFLPGGIPRRFKAGKYSFLPPARLAWIALSILIGSATHILWDSFTHRMYWPYRHWSFLRLNVAVPILEHMEMYKLLQYISTFGGMAVVAVWIWHWYRTTKPVEHPIARLYTTAQRGTMLVILPLAAICGGVFRAHERIRTLHGIRPVGNFTADAIVTAIAIFALGLLVCGIVLDGREAEGGRT